MRKKLLLIISLIMVSLSFFLGGCTKTEDKLEISFDQTEINFTYGMDTSKEVTLSLKNASENTDILFSETTKGIVNIVREDAEDKSWVKFTVTPKGTGSTRVIAYNATNSAIQAYFNVNVFQQVTDVYERKGVTLYCQVGGKLTLSANSHFNVSPDNANKGDLVYEKVEEGSTANVVVNRETGVIDATGADVVAGILKVKVYPWYNEDLAHILTIHVLKAISPSDVTLLRDSAPYELKHGVVNKIQLVKTKEEFAQTELVFSVSSDDNQIIEGTFEIANNAIAAIQQTDLTSFVVKSKELGATQVKFILNIQGVTNNAIAPLEYNFEIEVIDIPVDILLNGVSGKGVVHDLVIYNIYGENTLGQQLRFTLSPSSVIDKYANIVIALPAGAQDLISLFYEDGSEVDYSEGNRVIISADTTLYVSALPTVTTGTLEITAEAEISSLYDEPDELVRTTVRFTIKQGLSKLMFAHNNELYLPVGRTLNINLTVPEDELSNADTSRIICIDDYDKESITVDPTQNDLLFIVTAHKASTQALVFDSGNGHTARLILHVYNPLTSVKLETESIYENGSIGEKKYREDNKEILESIVVAVGTTLPVFIYTNDNATISRINREAKGSTISLNQDLVTVTSVGSSEYIVTVVGYTGDYEDFNEYPEEQDIEESFTLKITITGYVPISSITLTPLRATVYNAASVGYYKMDALSNLTLKSIIYPSSATTKDNVSWIIQEDPGFDKYTLTEVDNNTMIFSVKPSISAVIEETITIVVSISEYNRTYTQKCIITVLAAKQVTNIAFSNVIGNTITFDARKGLNEINSFKIQANVIPVDATNQNLRYHIVDEFGNFVKESNAIFSVTPDGIVTPLKGGVGYLRVAAEDSFDSANSPKMSVILEIIILDGKSEKTAFTISNVDELRAIGNSKETMSLYYVLADNIDIAQSKEWKNGWEPIGAKATVKESYPFTGQLSGRYVRKIYDSVTGEERELETNYCINNFVINKSITNTRDETYIGLFHSIGQSQQNSENAYYYEGVPKVGTIKNLTINVKKFYVDTSLFAFTQKEEEKLEDIIDVNLTIYAGVLAGRNCYDNQSYLNAENAYNGFGLINNTINIEGDFVVNIGKIESLTQTYNTYIGGVVGLNNGRIICDDASINTVKGNDIVVVDKFNYNGAILPQTFYVGGVAGQNEGLINGCILEEDPEKPQYLTLYGDAGMMVTSNINSKTIMDDNRYKIVSTEARVGGITGSNRGTINCVITENEVYGTCGVGGIAGENTKIISNSIFAGRVGGVTQVGGLVGFNNGTIDNCNVENYEDGRVGEYTPTVLADAAALVNYLASLSYGNLGGQGYTLEDLGIIPNTIGGFVGNNNGAITNSYAVTYMYKRPVALAGDGTYFGDVYVNLKTVSNSGRVSVGGFVGYNSGNISTSHSSYSTLIVSDGMFGEDADCKFATFIGEHSNTRGTITNCYAKGSTQVICGDDSVTTFKRFISNNATVTSIKTSYAAHITNLGDEYDTLAAEVEIFDDSGARHTTALNQNDLRNISILRNFGFDVDSASSVWFVPGDGSSSSRLEEFKVTKKINHGFPILINSGKILSAETPLDITINVDFKDDAEDVINSLGNEIQVVYFYTSDNIDTLKIINQSNKNIVAIDDLIETTVYPRLGKVQRFIIASSNEKVIQIMSNGDLKVVGEGNCIITVYSKLDKTKFDSVVVEAVLPINTFDLYKSSNTLSEASKITNSLELNINENNTITPDLGAQLIYSNPGSGETKKVSVKMNTNSGVRYIIKDNGISPAPYFYFEGKSEPIEGSNNVELTRLPYTYNSKDGEYYCDIPYGQKTIITTTNEWIRTPFDVRVVPYIQKTGEFVYYLDELAKSFKLSLKRGATDIFFIGSQSAVISSGSSSTINVMLMSDDPEDKIVCNIYEDGIIKNNLFIEDYLDILQIKHTAADDENYVIGFEKSVRIELKEENKLISEQHIYDVVFSSSQTAKVKATFKLIIKEQEVTLISIENFANGEIDYEGTTTGFNQYNKYEIATNKVIPGRSGIIKINTFPYFSYLDYVEITSKDIHFEQIVKNETIAETTYPYVYAGEFSTYLVDGIRLGNIYYDDTQNAVNKIQVGLTGTYYVRTQLYANVEEGTVIPINVKAYKIIDGKPTVVCERSQNVYVEYPPGVTLIYEGKTSASTSDQLFLAVGTTSELDIYVENSGNTDDVKLTSSSDYVTVKNVKGKGVITVSPAATNGDTVTISAEVKKVVGGVELVRTDAITFTIVDFIIKDIGFENVKDNKMNKIFGKEYALRLSVDNSTIIYDETNTKTKEKIQTLFDKVSSTNFNTWYGYKAKNGEDRIFDNNGFETSYYRITVLSNSTTYLVKGLKYDNQITNLKKIGATLKFYYNETTKAWDFIKIGLNVNRAGYSDDDLYYREGYSNGRYTFTLNRLFTLDFYLAYSDENRIPIYNAQQFLEMKENTDYILADNIILENFSGITKEIRSLDGDNKTITIVNSIRPGNKAEGDSGEEENSTDTIKLGLFQTIPEDGIYKNIRIVVENRLFVDAQNYKGVQFGLLAAENKGIVYNCSVEYLQTVSRYERPDALVKTVVNGEEREYNYTYLLSNTYSSKNEEVATLIPDGERGLCVQVSVDAIDNSIVQSSVGGLVGINTGYITNSRVVNNLPLHAYGNVGGLVSQNDGVVASSYYNGKITNYSIAVDASSTGGLVASNSGRINSCYTEGAYIPGSGTTGVLIEVQTTTNAAGFVYSNTGEIKNCYSNLRISSQSPTAGFVYENTGSIDTSYSTSIVQFNNLKSTAFIGVDTSNNSMNSGDVTNCYYLDIDDNYPVKESYVSKIDSEVEFENIETYANFAITQETGDYKDYVWKMTQVAVNKFKPTLLSPNKVVNLNMDEGAEENPYMIYSADTFNKLITLPVTGTITNKNDKYYTIVRDISFETSDLTAATYDMIFSGNIEGNGMNIENLRVSNTESNTSLKSIGLFSVLKDATIKNINVVPSEILGSNIQYVGGLAGTIETSKIFSVSVKADNVVIQGKNFVGGLAGVILGSNIQDIKINVSVNSTYRTEIQQYYGFDRYETVTPDTENGYELGDIKYVDYLSYAGGLAGATLSHIKLKGGKVVTTNNSIEGVTISDNVKVIGELVGSAVGYNGKNSALKGVSTLINENHYLKANSVIGGIVAHNAGEIDFAYIEHEKEIQDKIDSVDLGVIAPQTHMSYYRSAVNDKDYTLPRGFTIGGIVGINDGGSVRNSYSRVDIINEYALMAGGIIGISSEGIVENCYSSISIDIGTIEQTVQDSTQMGESNQYKFIGGIVGKVSNTFTKYFINQADLYLHNSLYINEKDASNKYETDAQGNIIPDRLFKINSVVAANNWLIEDAKNMGYENVPASVSKEESDRLRPVYSEVKKGESGDVTVLTAVPLTGGLIGATYDTKFIVTDDKTLNAYNGYVYTKSGATGNTAVEVGKTVRKIAEIGGVSPLYEVGDSSTSIDISIIKEDNLSVCYDIFKMTSNGEYKETTTSSYYKNFSRPDGETEGYKNYVFKMALLTNYEFKNEFDHYPKLKTIATQKFTSYVGNIGTGVGANKYNEEALFGTVLKTSQGEAYEISSPYQLRCLSFIVNNNIIDTSNLAFNVTREIRLSNDKYIPIGVYDSSNKEKGIRYAFKGVFTGNGNTIKNINCSENLNVYSLFGHTDGARITDVKVELNHTYKGFAHANDYEIAGIVGYAKDTNILSCYSKVTLTVETMAASGIEVGSLNIGGIAAYVDGGSISKCYTDADIKVIIGVDDNGAKAQKGVNIGGLVGIAKNTTIKNCHAGNAASGIKISHDLSQVDAVDATNSPKNMVGGLVANAEKTTISNTFAYLAFTFGATSIKNLVYELNDEQLAQYLTEGRLDLGNSDTYNVLSAFETMGSGVGSAENCNVYNSFFKGDLKLNKDIKSVQINSSNDYTSLSVKAEDISDSGSGVPIERAIAASRNSVVYGVQNNPDDTLIADESWYSTDIWYNSEDYNWSFEDNTGVWNIKEGESSPVIETVYTVKVDEFNGRYGKYDYKTDIYLIETNEQLNNLANDISDGTLRNGALGYNFKLSKEDETVNYYLENLTIGSFNNPFRGTFDGSGYVVTLKYNKTITSNTAVGLFGRCEGAIIKNVIIKGTITVTSSSGILYVGSVCGLTKGGYIDGAISNVRYTITQKTDKYTYIGGLVGQTDNQVLTNSFYSLVQISDSLVIEDVASAVASVIDETSHLAFVDNLRNNDTIDSSFENLFNSIIIDSSVNHIRYGGIIGYLKNQSVIIKNNVAVASLTASNAVPESVGQLFGVIIESGFGQENITGNYYSEGSSFNLNDGTTTVKVVGKGDNTTYAVTNLPLTPVKPRAEGTDTRQVIDNEEKFKMQIFNNAGINQIGGPIIVKGNITYRELFSIQNYLPVNMQGNTDNAKANGVTFTSEQTQELFAGIGTSEAASSVTIKNLTLNFTTNFAINNNGSVTTQGLLFKNIREGDSLTLENVTINATLFITNAFNSEIGYAYGALVGVNDGTITVRNCIFNINVIIINTINEKVTSIGSIVGENNGSLKLENVTTKGYISVDNKGAAINAGGVVGFTTKNSTLNVNSYTSETEMRFVGDVIYPVNIGGIVGKSNGKVTVEKTSIKAGQIVEPKMLQYYIGDRAIPSEVNMGGFIGFEEYATGASFTLNGNNTIMANLKFTQTPQSALYKEGYLHIGGIVGRSQRGTTFGNDGGKVVSICTIDISAICDINAGGILGYADARIMKNVYSYTDIKLASKLQTDSEINLGGIVGELLIIDGYNGNIDNVYYSGLIDISAFRVDTDNTGKVNVNIGSYVGYYNQEDESGSDAIQLSQSSFKLQVNGSASKGKYKVGMFGKLKLTSRQFTTKNGAISTGIKNAIVVENSYYYADENSVGEDNVCLGFLVGEMEKPNANAFDFKALSLAVAIRGDKMGENRCAVGTDDPTSALNSGLSLKNIYYYGNTAGYTVGLDVLINRYSLADGSITIINDKATAKLFFILAHQGNTNVLTNRVIFRIEAGEVAEAWMLQYPEYTGCKIIIEKEYGFVCKN